MDKWSFIPKEPSFPAFFLGALSVGIYPSDTFLKLEVCRTPFLPYPPIFLGHGAQLASVECSVTPVPRDLLVAPYDRNPATSLWQRSGLRAEPPVVLLVGGWVPVDSLRLTALPGRLTAVGWADLHGYQIWFTLVFQEHGVFLTASVSGVTLPLGRLE